MDFTFPDNEEPFICFQYSKNTYIDSGRDNAIVTFPRELFGEVKWIVVGEVIRYEYENENNTRYKCIYQDLQQSLNGVLTSIYNDGELIAKEPTTGDIISPNDTIKLNDTPYGVVVPEVDPDEVYDLSFNSPTLIIFQNPKKISSWGIDTGENLTEIRGLNLVDTSNITNLHEMFNMCSKLTSLNLSGWDVSSVTNMNAMFNSCMSLTTIIGPITGVTQSIAFNSCPLKHNSAMVFLNGLDTVTETKTITFKSTTYRTLTEAEIAAATAKGWMVQSAA